MVVQRGGQRVVDGTMSGLGVQQKTMLSYEGQRAELVQWLAVGQGA